jgi:hypothetical protein
VHQLPGTADGPGLARQVEDRPRNWKTAKDDSALVEEVVTLSEQFGKRREDDGAIRRLCREDLELIRFEYVSA